MTKNVYITGVLLTLMVILGLAGCAGQSKKERSLQETLNAYEHTIRWTKMENINNFLKEPVEFSAKAYEELKHIQVTAYRVLSRSVRKKQIYQLVEIEYYHDENATIRTLTDAQKWEYDDEEERWFLVSPIPKFKF